MHLFLLKPRGFCAGVKRAIQTVEKAIERFGAPVYVKHQIVHNRHVVETLEKKGAIFVEDLKEVPEGSKIIYSAHGVSPKAREEAKIRNLREIDATCPLVTKSHLAAKKYAEKGYKILLIGHKKHIEVIGIQEEAFASTTVIESLEDIAKLDFVSAEKLFYLMQTTLNVEKTKLLIQALRLKYPQIETLTSSSICYATTSRQKALFFVLDKIDAAFIIGDPSSSNSNRLKEMAAEKIRAYLIHKEEEITKELVEGVKVIALTAGASTPEAVVQRCVKRLQALGVKTIEEVSDTEVDKEAVFSVPQELLALDLG